MPVGLGSTLGLRYQSVTLRPLISPASAIMESTHCWERSMSQKSLSPWLNTALALSLVLTGLSATGGCAKTNKKEAYHQWNAARAGVQGSLAAERYKLGSLDDARKAVDEAIKLDPENPTYHLLSARIYIEKNQLEQADQELASVRKVAPKNAEADYLAGIIYQRWQKPQLALDYYSQACEKAPGELQYLMARSELLVQVGKMDEAITLIESKLTYFEYSGPLRDLLGGLYMQQGKTPQAIEALHQASVLAPDDSVIREHLMRAYFKGSAYRDCLTQIDLLLKGEEFQKRADIYMLQGECQLQIGQFDAARQSLETSLEKNPSSIPARLSLAKVAIRKNDLDRADVALRGAAALDPNEPQVHLGLGYLRMRQQRWPDALSAFERAAELDPKDPVAICMVGLVYEKMGKPDAAMTQYGKALQMNPDNKLAKQLLSKAK